MTKPLVRKDAPQAPKGRLSERATPATGMHPDLSDYWIKGLLTGAPKSGKSTSATTLPHDKYGKLLFIDCDGRAESLVPFDHVEVIRLSPQTRMDKHIFETLEQVGDDLWIDYNDDALPYDGIVIDGLSAINRWCLWWTYGLVTSGGKPIATGPGGSPGEAHWGPQVTALERFLLSLTPMKRHIVLTAHYAYYELRSRPGEPKKDHPDYEKFWPKMFGKNRTEIAGWFNESYRCYTRPSVNGTQYYWRTSADSKMDFIGSAMNRLNKLWKDPIKIDFNEPVVGYQKLLGYLKEARK